jgi:hypothetical protein
MPMGYPQAFAKTAPVGRKCLTRVCRVSDDRLVRYDPLWAESVRLRRNAFKGFGSTKHRSTFGSIVTLANMHDEVFTAVYAQIDPCEKGHRS